MTPAAVAATTTYAIAIHMTRIVYVCVCVRPVSYNFHYGDDDSCFVVYFLFVPSFGRLFNTRKWEAVAYSLVRLCTSFIYLMQ